MLGIDYFFYFFISLLLDNLDLMTWIMNLKGYAELTLIFF